jgi:hypothetical protein
VFRLLLYVALVSPVLQSSHDPHVGVINDREFCCMMWRELFRETSCFVPHCLKGGGASRKRVKVVTLWQSVACYEEVKKIKFRAGLNDNFWICLCAGQSSGGVAVLVLNLDIWIQMSGHLHTPATLPQGNNPRTQWLGAKGDYRALLNFLGKGKNLLHYPQPY